MNHTTLSFQEAVFLASLPYRKDLYSYGGWRKTGGPGTDGWNDFLRHFYLNLEIQGARERAKEYSNPYWVTLGGIRHEMKTVSLWSDNYPYFLQAIYDPPPVLFFWGPEWNIYEEYIAMVGTRSANELCQMVCKLFIQAKKTKNGGDSSLCIVSGMAFGVDRMAHLAAIEHGVPCIAVLASGIKYAGPRRNLDLITRASKRRVPYTLLTEFAPWVQAFPSHFPRRNRIIAGLVAKIAVIQAPRQSGALITARYGLEEGRDVIAFDHPIFDSWSGSNAGARKLLQNGAEKIILPELEEKIRCQPKDSYRPTQEQLSFWKEELDNPSQAIGGKYLIR